MVKKLALALGILLICGCAFKQPMLLNGTSLKLGCYIPWENNLYGLELMSFTTGTLVMTPTNGLFSIEHHSSSTNSWMWGMLDTNESSETKVKLK